MAIEKSSVRIQPLGKYRYATDSNSLKYGGRTYRSMTLFGVNHVSKIRLTGNNTGMITTLKPRNQTLAGNTTTNNKMLQIKKCTNHSITPEDGPIGACESIHGNNY
ncbi:MAG TPA: hypothetical protein VFV39_02735 [Limnobacter sp.]|nr:hypothetical protein [Limnobacter sp.]